MTEELNLAIDHVSLSVADLASAREFYVNALEAIGLEIVGELSEEVAGVNCIGFGRGRKGSLWVVETGQQTPATHICFRAESRADVRAFHAAAMSAGGSDNGPPGIREVYHPEYYAAFVLDPEGHNIEAVCFMPEEQS